MSLLYFAPQLKKNIIFTLISFISIIVVIIIAFNYLSKDNYNTKKPIMDKANQGDSQSLFSKKNINKVYMGTKDNRTSYMDNLNRTNNRFNYSEIIERSHSKVNPLEKRMQTNDDQDLEEQTQNQILIILSNAFTKNELFNLFNDKNINGEIRKTVIQVMDKNDFLYNSILLLADENPLIRDEALVKIISLDLSEKEINKIQQNIIETIQSETDSYAFRSGLMVLDKYFPNEIDKIFNNLLSPKEMETENILVIIEFIKENQQYSHLMSQIYSNQKINDLCKDT